MPDRIPDTELILQLGAEGAGARIYRIQLDSGEHAFYVRRTTMVIDENLVDDWHHGERGPFPSLEAALQSVAADGTWVIWDPGRVHAEYRAAVWELVKRTARSLPPQRKETWREQRRIWRRECHVPASPPSPITARQIDPILPFLEIFEQPDFSFGEWRTPESNKPDHFFLPYFELSEPAEKFVQALYKHKWVAPFNWPSWREIAERYVDAPQLIGSADTETIRKLLTTHVRQDRFCEGHLAAMFENGHICALLRRLMELRHGPEPGCAQGRLF